MDDASYFPSPCISEDEDGYYSTSSDNSNMHRLAGSLPSTPRELIFNNTNTDTSHINRTMASTPTLEDTPTILGDAYLKGFCGGSFQAPLADKTIEKRLEVFKVYQACCVAMAPDEIEEEDVTYPPFWLTLDNNDNPTAEVDWLSVKTFLSYYIRHHGGQKLTKSQFKKVCDALTDWVNENLRANKYPAQRGIIRGNEVVKSIGRSINKLKVEHDNDANIDIHRDLLRTVSPEQKLMFINECYLPTPGKPTSRLDPLTRLQVAIGKTVSSGTLQRSEHVRGLKYKFSLTRTLKELGPGLGTETDIVISNFGKENKNGNIKTKAVPPHV
jgi:hypothetical protein